MLTKAIFLIFKKYGDKGAIMKTKMIYVLLALVILLCVTAVVLALVDNGNDKPGEEGTTVIETVESVPDNQAGDIEIDIGDLFG